MLVVSAPGVDCSGEGGPEELWLIGNGGLEIGPSKSLVAKMSMLPAVSSSSVAGFGISASWVGL